MPQQVPGTIGRATSAIPKKVGQIQQGKTDNKTKSGLMSSVGMGTLGAAGINNPASPNVSVAGGMNPFPAPGGNPYPTPSPISGPNPSQNPFGNPINNPTQMPSVTGQVPGQYGGMVTPDADGRGFTNADGGHDWNVGQGPGGDWNGEDQRTGQAPVGQDPGSGDALGFPRGTPQYRQATQAHKAWIQQNRAAGRTLADLGMSPTRGGGLSNFMEMASTPRGAVGNPGVPNPGNPTNPTLPSTGLGGSAKGTPGMVKPGFTTGPVGGEKGFGGTPVASTPYTGPGFVNNAVPGATPQQPQLQAQKRQQPMRSMGFSSSPLNMSRIG